MRLSSSSLYEDVHLHGSLHEHLDTRHEGADLTEVTLTDHLRVVGERRVVVTGLDCLDDVV